MTSSYDINQINLSFKTQINKQTNKENSLCSHSYEMVFNKIFLYLDSKSMILMSDDQFKDVNNDRQYVICNVWGIYMIIMIGMYG